jgi:DNA-binding HxlR family transcriptional regulator
MACAPKNNGRHCLLSGVMDLLGRKYVMGPVCPVEARGQVRFGETEAHLPDASTSTLSTQLDELEAIRLLRRDRYDEIPPRVEYELNSPVLPRSGLPAPRL